MNNRIAWIAALAVAVFASAAGAQTITAVYTTYSDTGVPTKLDITGTAFCSTTPCGTKAPVVRLAGNLISISGSSPTGIGVPLTGQPDGDYMLSVTPYGKTAITYAFTLKSKTGGATGPQGPAGPIGPAGPAGAVGQQGPQGLMGLQGPPGVAGTDGAQGLMGLQGPKGDVGLTGPVGPKGDKGDTGVSGSFPDGNVKGAMLVWDGTSWQEIAPPKDRGVTLIFCDSGPLWATVCPSNEPNLYFTENFSTGILDPLKLEDPDDAFEIVAGRVHRKKVYANEYDRHYIRTARTDYNTVDWIFRFTYHVSANAPVEVFFAGYGEGVPEAGFANEPSNSAHFRIHHGQVGSIDPRIEIVAHTSGPFNWAFLNVLGRVEISEAGGDYNVMICKSGDSIKFTLSDAVSVNLTGTIPIVSSYLPSLNSSNSRLFFGAVKGEYEFSNVSVTPLTGACP